MHWHWRCTRNSWVLWSVTQVSIGRILKLWSCGLWAVLTFCVSVLIYDWSEDRGPYRSFDRWFLPQKAILSSWVECGMCVGESRFFSVCGVTSIHNLCSKMQRVDGKCGTIATAGRILSVSEVWKQDKNKKIHI